MIRLLLAYTLLAPGTAWAGDCSTKYSLAQFAADMGAMQSSLRTLDETTFKAVGKNLQNGLPCMATVAPTPVYATAYRLLGAWEYIQGNTTTADGWFLSSQELDPAFTWDVKDFDVGHPLRLRYEELKAQASAPPVPIPDVHIASPAGSTYLIDGRPLTEPAATTKRPHLVQQVASDKSVRASWLIEGNALPEAVLGMGSAPQATVTDAEPRSSKGRSKDPGSDPAPKEKSSREKKPASGEPVVMVVDRQRPPMKTPLLVLGGVGLGASAACYLASTGARDKFDGARTSDEIYQYRTTTNSLVLASGGLAVMAVGLGYWGVLLDGRIGLGISGNF